MKKDADIIIDAALRSVMPAEAVAQALKGKCFGSGRLYLVAAGKAAWQMAKAAAGILGDRLQAGVCVTKYGHVQGHIPKILCCEAGHPVPDENSFRGTQAALDLVREVRKEDVIVFLLSGGGSALFEKPFIAGKELSDITSQLLACGADITEINMIRKRLSAVKGGRFARSCAPAKIYSIVLSDILGDPLDMIASGPAYPDSSTCAQAQAVAEKYGLRLSHRAMELLKVETPKELEVLRICAELRHRPVRHWGIIRLSSRTGCAARPGRQAAFWRPLPGAIRIRNKVWRLWQGERPWCISQEAERADGTRSWHWRQRKASAG